MSSETLYDTCDSCNRTVMKSDNKCRHCGQRLNVEKRLGRAALAIGLLVIIVYASMGDSTSSSTSASADSKAQEPSYIVPAEQSAFIEIVEKYREGYRGAGNELVKSEMRDARAMAMMRSDVEQKISQWTGTVIQLDVTGDGEAILRVELANDLTVGTWNNSLSDIGDETLIPRGHPVYRTLRDLKRGDRVTFAGTFLPSELDYYKESSLTLEGSMTDPEYLFRFTRVTPVN